MKKFKLTVMAALLLACTTPALAIEVTGDAYVGVYSDYLWRGYNLSGDDDLVIQPGANISFGGFTVGWWGNFSENTGELNEVDLTLDYSLELNDMVSVSVGNILYDIDNGIDHNGHLTKGTTNEAYLGVAVNTLLSPAVKVYYDYDEFDGNVFAVASIGHSFSLAEKLGLNLAAAAGYSFVDEDFSGTGDDENFLHNGEVSAGIDYAVTEQISLSLIGLYSTPLSSDAEDIAGIDDEATVGLTVSLAF